MAAHPSRRPLMGRIGHGLRHPSEMGHAWREAQAARQAKMKAAFSECSSAPSVTLKSEDQATKKDVLTQGDLTGVVPCSKRDVDARKRPGAAHPRRGRTLTGGNILQLQLTSSSSTEKNLEEDLELGVYQDDGSSSEDSLSARTVTDQLAAPGPLGEDSPRNKGKVSRPTSSSSGKGVADTTQDAGEKVGPNMILFRTSNMVFDKSSWQLYLYLYIVMCVLTD